jgi:hypothetical protein
VGLLIPCSLLLVAAFCRLSPAQDVLEYISTNTNSALIVPAWQTHMPTKQDNVPRLNPQEEQIDPKAQAKIKQDPAQLQREARELLELSQSSQLDIESVNRGLHPKDTIEKLKRIQKLAKHLRGEIEP